LASRFLSKSKPPGIHLLAQTSDFHNSNPPKKLNWRQGLSTGTYGQPWIIAFIQYTMLDAYLSFSQLGAVLKLERRNPAISILL
jgi:hypothetical protein